MSITWGQRSQFRLLCLLLLMGCGVLFFSCKSSGGSSSDTDTHADAKKSFAQRAYIKASNTGRWDGFGGKIAMSDDVIVVGVRGEDSDAMDIDGDQMNNNAGQSGAAYVYVRDGAKSWRQQSYLKASNTNSGDEFGHSVAIFGDTIVVGAMNESSDATGVNSRNQSNNDASKSGAAYVFIKYNDTWMQQAYLKSSNAGINDYFGTSVAISGDTIVVGAYGEDTSASNSGAAYVFVRNGATWSEQAFLKASTPGKEDHFGWAVAISGDTIVVGAYNEDSSTDGINGDQSDDSAPGSGAAYVFVRNGDTWTQQAFLKASNSGGSDRFGYSVAISGDLIAVGAIDEKSNATGVDGDQSDDSADGAGAVYLFEREGLSWRQQAYIKASNTGDQDNFGFSLSLSKDSLLVGAYREDGEATGINGDQSDNSSDGSGAAYLFKREGDSWRQQSYLKASNNDKSDFFGAAVFVSGETVLVGASGEDSSADGINGDQANNSFLRSGAVYVFE